MAILFCDFVIKRNMMNKFYHALEINVTEANQYDIWILTNLNINSNKYFIHFLKIWIGQQ